MADQVKFTLAALLWLPAAALAHDCRLTLADQSNWFANTGFYMNLENSPAGAASYCQVANLTIAMGVADGTQWRFIGANPGWTMDHDYTATAVIAPAYFELYLDGRLLGHADGGFAGLPGQDLQGALAPYGYTGASDYLASQSALTASAANGVPVSASISPGSRAVPLAMLAPGSVAVPTPFGFGAGDTLTVIATFRLTAAPSDPKTYAPHVDKYGQSVYASYPGKIQTDADLQAAAAGEQTRLAAWGLPDGYDPWGGVLQAGWQDTATGFFHVVQRNSVWWLISPAGNPCFYIGLDTAPLTSGNNTPTTGREWEFAALPPQTSPYDAAWSYWDWGNTGIASASFDTWNMIRKYGGDSWYSAAVDLTVQRMRAWGFSGLGKWSGDAGNLPILPVLWPYNVPVLAQHPDIFDPQVQALFKGSLQQQIQARATDPLILGWSFGNEYDEIITPDEIQSILGMRSAVSAKRALVDQALSGIYHSSVAAMAAAWGVTAATAADLYAASPAPPAADVETLRQYYEDRYYGFLYETIKAIDPHHLFFGTWLVPGWWVNSTDWALIAAHTDVIGYDRYSPVFEDSLLQGLARSTGKPVFLGEFGFPPHYNLMRGYQVFPAAFAVDDADAGAQYQAALEAAARNPWCVGVAWFEYRDEPVSGRGFFGETNLNLVEGESYAFGLVDVADRPKYDLVEQVRTTNLAMAQRRLAFAPPGLNAGGTVNNASFAAHAPVAPGSLVSIFGSGLSAAFQTAAAAPLPLTLGGASLALGGVPLPLIHAFPLQADAQIPWELAGQSQAQLVIVTDDLTGNTVSVPLAPFSPGIYSADGNGAGQGAVLLNGATTLAAPAHSKYKGRPARRGADFINIFATGLGPVTNQPDTGAPAPALPLAETTSEVVVSIGGVAATATFAGLAPGWVGLYQVNVQVPANAPAGDAVPVALRVGGIASNQVTIALE